MKKSCLVAVITVLAAVAGALAAVAVYLHRREKELDEYERLLFGEDDAETVEPAAPAEDSAPAEDAAELQKTFRAHRQSAQDCFGAPFLLHRSCFYRRDAEKQRCGRSTS